MMRLDPLDREKLIPIAEGTYAAIYMKRVTKPALGAFHSSGVSANSAPNMA